MINVKSPAILLCCFTAAALMFSQVPQKKSLDGLWLSDGYGNLYEINGDTIGLWQYTSVGCIQTGAGKKVAGGTGNVFALEGSSRKLDIIEVPF